MRYYQLRIVFYHTEYSNVFFSSEAIIEHLNDTPLVRMLSLQGISPEEELVKHIHRESPVLLRRDLMRNAYEPIHIMLDCFEDNNISMSRFNQRTRFPVEHELPSTARNDNFEAFLSLPITKGKIIGTIRQMLFELEQSIRERVARDEGGNIFVGSLRASGIEPPPQPAPPAPEPENDGIRRIVMPNVQDAPRNSDDNEEMSF